MVSRRLFIAVAVAFAALMLAAAPPASAAKEYRANLYDVKLVVEPGGSMLVTETVEFAFGDDRFTSVSRGIPVRRIDGLTVLSAAMDGRAMTPGDGPGQFEVRHADKGVRRVVWHFATITNTTRTFTLTYRVAGIVRHTPDADLLLWLALPTKHEYGITCAAVELSYPPSAAVRAEPTVDPPVSAVVSSDFMRRFTRCGFERDDSWLVRAEFASRSVAAALPDWQRRAAVASRELPLFLGLAGMVLLAGLVGFAMFRFNNRPQIFQDRHVRQTSPPDGLPVVIGAALAQSGRANWDIGLGTLLELARRGVIRIDEVAGESVFRQRDFAVTAARGQTSLRPAERAIYDLLFTTKSGPRASVKFSQLARTFGSASRWKRFSQAVREELNLEGLIDADRARTRGRATVVAVGTIALGVLGLVAAVPFVDEYGGASLMIGVAFMAVGLAGVIMVQSMSPLTDDGVRRSKLWQAYGRHLKTVSSGKQVSSVMPDVFERALPSAVAFGVGLAWAKALHAHGVTAGPSWLRAMTREGDSGGHMAATIAMLSSGHSASESVDHAAVGAAASSAAGGGSSSAG